MDNQTQEEMNAQIDGGDNWTKLKHVKGGGSNHRHQGSKQDMGINTQPKFQNKTGNSEQSFENRC